MHTVIIFPRDGIKFVIEAARATHVRVKWGRSEIGARPVKVALLSNRKAPGSRTLLGSLYRAKNSAVAARTLSICSPVCAVETNPASNCEGAI